MSYIIKTVPFVMLWSFVFACFFGFTPYAHAQMITNLNSGPLFDEQNIVPGENYHATIEVKNEYAEDKNVYIVGHNVADPHNLAEEVHISITEGSTEYFNAPLDNFFAAGQDGILLSAIAAGADTEYELTIRFADSGTTQDNTLVFDICVGFAGGTATCANGGDEGNEDDVQQPTTSGGGGSGGGFSSLSEEFSIFNEDALVLSPTSAIISWNTNFPGSSEVVYGPLDGGPYAFNIQTGTPYGYPLTTVEDPSLVTDHSMLLTDLEPGATYVYRIVSRDAEGTVNASGELEIDISAEGEVLGATTIPSSPMDAQRTGHRGVVLAAGTGNDVDALHTTTNEEKRSTNTEEKKDSNNTDQTALALLGSESLSDFFGSGGCIIGFLAVLLGIFIVWKGIDTFYGLKYTYRTSVRMTYMYGFFDIAATVAFVYALITESCILVPIAFALVGSLILFLWYLWSSV